MRPVLRSARIHTNVGGPMRVCEVYAFVRRKRSAVSVQSFKHDSKSCSACTAGCRVSLLRLGREEYSCVRFIRSQKTSWGED
jgi:hypothetical protein